MEQAVVWSPPWDSQAVRVMFMPWTPIWSMQPPTTWSTSPLAMPARFRHSICTGPRMSAGWVWASVPLRLPTAERTASTITTSVMSDSFLGTGSPSALGS